MPCHRVCIHAAAPQVVTGAVLIRDQFGNGVGDILIDIRRSDGGQVLASSCECFQRGFRVEFYWQLEGLMWSENVDENGRHDVV